MKFALIVTYSTGYFIYLFVFVCLLLSKYKKTLVLTASSCLRLKLTFCTSGQVQRNISKKGVTKGENDSGIFL